MKLNPVILIIVAVLGVYVGLSINKEQPVPSVMSEEKTIKTDSVEQEKVENSKGERLREGATSEYNYKIIYEVEKRYDGALSYYVLIDPVNVENTKFKDKMNYIVNDLVKKKGNKISVEIYDNKDALVLHYKLYGDMSLGRVLNNEEYIFVGNHHVAGFSGELNTDLFFNTLYYYPAANSEDNPLVGKYAGAIEYNPK
ncbi:hypothetical protein SAMN05192533_105128 [Mesobacillus persicus]|uniref:Uncharacterized protein n=1 Tax=Mesobacillus persicus TaxID=930146 RepID=A0A1H8ARK7_9BACI|nr:hypothetical protein [Mesobacillus persicus]SEM73335.1 hypothetical protein SAMN05192533_105128 [Mesobacillus persicus]